MEDSEKDIQCKKTLNKEKQIVHKTIHIKGMLNKR